jgi:hypothetical protein
VDYHILNLLESRWRIAFEQDFYDTLVERVEQALHRTEYATGERYNLRPLFFKRYPGRGRVIKDASSDQFPLDEYGFDAQDRVILRRQHHPIYPPIESYYIYHPDSVEIVTYKVITAEDDIIPGQIEHVYSENGRVSLYASFMLNGYGPGPQYYGELSPDALLNLFSHPGGLLRTHETYHYDEEGRVDHITLSHRGHFPQTRVQVEGVKYDSAGQVIEIISESDDHKRVVYRKPRRGDTFKSLVEDATAKLVETIPNMIAAANFREPIYSLHLSYRSVSYYFPPHFTVGLEANRQRWLIESAEEARWKVWYPALHQPDLFGEQPITDRATLEACERLEQAIQSTEAWDKGRKAVRDVSKALAKVEWASIAPVTSDFIVYTLDYKEDEVEDALRLTATKAQINVWKKMGLL